MAVDTTGPREVDGPRTFAGLIIRGLLGTLLCVGVEGDADTGAATPRASVMVDVTPSNMGATRRTPLGSSSTSILVDTHSCPVALSLWCSAWAWLRVRS